MGTVLRLHKEADNNLKDWVGGTHRCYGLDVIDQIEDPGGARADKEITSIPSPFARIDLACNAFKNVAESETMDGSTIWHKIVSDCLDIAELFFNFDKLADKLEILVWDKNYELSKLENSSVREHQILAGTLKMYLEQDSAAYNFNLLDKIFLLRYKGRAMKSDMDIIGATSPRTLFFSSANDLSYCSDDLRQRGSDKPFDNDYAPLYKRDFAFQKYLYSLRIAFGETKFAERFPEFNEYLQQSRRFLSNDQKEALEKLDENSIYDFPEFALGSNRVEVIGLTLHKSNAINPDEMKSDFFIDSKIWHGKRPLVLPVESGNRYSDLRYVQDRWQGENRAEYADYRDLDSRTLPFTADKYPYLTISDFLTTAIISTPLGMSSNFFNGNLEDDTDCKSFLLPLKDIFFKFFTVKQLMEPMPDGKNMIEMKPFGASNVQVILRIPVQRGRYIEYVRDYKKTDEEIFEAKNEGKVIERKFGLGVLPPVDFNSLSANPYQRVAFFAKSRNSKLSFAGENGVVDAFHSVRREAGAVCSIESYVIENNFDRICVEIDKVKNVVVPVLQSSGTAKKFTFAVDFGTTNTHIEYSVDDSRISKPFDISSSDLQIFKLHNGYDKEDRDISAGFLDAFIPDTIGCDDDYAFPIRTVFAESLKIDYRKPVYSLADGNIPFRYEKVAKPQYDKYVTDLKWSSKDTDRVRLYLDNLFLLMRNKVILSGGGLENTRIIWFYPASMLKAHCNKFSDIWKELYRKYFGDNVEDNLIMMSESVAPYNYYKRDLGAKSNVVTIDIGGGTTDVFVVEENKPSLLSSFRFAANSVFGDGYNFPITDNGFVNAFKNEIAGCLDANGLNDLKGALNSIESSADSSNDIIAFYFSLASNKSLRNKNRIDFLQMLDKDDKLRYPFIVFYGAIIYYVASMMKAQRLNLPQTIAFSGNGSKTLKVLSTDKKTLAQFAQIIFEKVYGKKYSGVPLELILEDEPKLATCKGGISAKENLSFEQIRELKTSLLGIDNSTVASDFRYDEIGNNEIASIAAGVSKFIDFLFEVNDENGNFFVDSFSADASVIRKVKAICNEDLVEYTKQGLSKKIEELAAWGTGKDSVIEETLFFYPIVAMLSNLARKIR